MKPYPSRSTFLTMAALAACTMVSQAHISYNGRDFGTFAGGEAPVTILNNTIRGNFSWADGTDEDYGSSEIVRAYRFNLTYNARITVDVSATTFNGALLGDLLPGFSIYSGLGHTAPDPLDHDEALNSIAWRNSTPGVTKEGNFRALGDWKAGNSETDPEAPLSSFLFRAYAVDGTAANFGPVAGITGDGVADGRVVASFDLPAGTYSLFVGGADYFSQAAGNAQRGVNVTLTVIPEPTGAVLSSAALAGLLLRRRR